MTRSASYPGNGGPYLKIVVLFVTVLLFGLVSVSPTIDSLLFTEPDWLPPVAVAGIAFAVTLAVVLLPEEDYSTAAIITAVVATVVYASVGQIVLTPGLDLEGSTLILADLGGLTVGALAVGLLAADLAGSESPVEGQT